MHSRRSGFYFPSTVVRQESFFSLRVNRNAAPTPSTGRGPGTLFGGGSSMKKLSMPKQSVLLSAVNQKD